MLQVQKLVIEKLAKNERPDDDQHNFLNDLYLSNDYE